MVFGPPTTRQRPLFIDYVCSHRRGNGGEGALPIRAKVTTWAGTVSTRLTSQVTNRVQVRS